MSSRAAAPLLALVVAAGCRADQPPASATTTTVSGAPDGAATGASGGAARSDDETWNSARLAGQGNAVGACGGIEPVKAYQLRFPSGRHADEARKLLPELEDECEQMTRRQQVAAPWVDRQRQRQSAYLAHQSCVSACRNDAACEGQCAPAPTFRNRCVPCVLNGRCQLLTNSDAPGSLDCCLPVPDDGGCIK